MPIKVGDSVVIIDGGLRYKDPKLVLHIGKNGIVLETDRDFFEPKTRSRVQLDDGISKWFWDADLVFNIKYTLPYGHIYCKCGTITINKNCCDCKGIDLEL